MVDVTSKLAGDDWGRGWDLIMFVIKRAIEFQSMCFLLTMLYVHYLMPYSGTCWFSTFVIKWRLQKHQMSRSTQRSSPQGTVHSLCWLASCIYLPFHSRQNTYTAICIHRPWSVTDLLRFSETCKLYSSRQLLRNMFFAVVNQNYGDRQPMNLERQKQKNASKSTYHNWQSWPFVDPVKANFCFLRGPLRWLTTAKNLFRSSLWLEQSAHVSENRSNMHTFTFQT